MGVDLGPCAPVYDELIPYFDRWDDIYNEWDSGSIELSPGEEYEFFFPEAFDCCNNAIEIKVDLKDIAEFVNW